MEAIKKVLEKIVLPCNRAELKAQFAQAAKQSLVLFDKLTQGFSIGDAKKQLLVKFGEIQDKMLEENKAAE